jgi:protease I
MPAEIAFKDVNPEEYPGIFFSGGHAPEYIREDEDFLCLTHCFLRRTHPELASVTASEFPLGPTFPHGCRMATVAKCKFDLEVCGGTSVDRTLRY